MVSSAVRSLTPWLPSEAVDLPGATASGLNNTVCRMVPLTVEALALGQVATVAAALKQLVGQTMALRSPTGGWPADLPQTADNLGPYLSEETAELLEVLATLDQTPPPPPGTLIAIPDLVPHLLWMLASSGYEIMRLIEGVQARIYSPEAEGAVHIVRLVPVLALTVDETTYAFDLVTQSDPLSPLYLGESTKISLLDNDLDSQPLLCGDLLGHIANLIGCTQPNLTALLHTGYPIDVLRPFQPWQVATLHLHLHLAEMEPQGHPQPHVDATDAAPNTLYLPRGANRAPQPLLLALPLMTLPTRW